MAGRVEAGEPAGWMDNFLAEARLSPRRLRISWICQGPSVPARKVQSLGLVGFIVVER